MKDLQDIKRVQYFHTLLLGMIFGLLCFLVCGDAMAADLPMKIDTIGVDTVGWVRDSMWVDCSPPDNYNCMYLRRYWKPTLHYTTDTTYRLTPEQVDYFNMINALLKDTTLDGLWYIQMELKEISTGERRYYSPIPDTIKNIPTFGHGEE